MVIQGIKDRSKIREIRWQGSKGVEKKVKQEKQEKGSKERPRDGCPWDEGEIQGRSREDP